MSGETTPLLPDCGSSSAKSLRIDGPTSQLVSALGCHKQTFWGAVEQLLRGMIAGISDPIKGLPTLSSLPIG